jgi:hypothetical protein
MFRRIYFAVPDNLHARHIVTELEAAGIDGTQIHALAKSGVDLSDLPSATLPQRHDRVWTLENLFWKGDLVLFGIATVVLVLALVNAWIIGAIAAMAVMLVTFLVGNHFAVNLPHTHLGDLQVPFKHGEIVLTVDVPRTRVREIEQLVSRHHPEAGVSGIGWTIHALGT